MKRRTSTLPCKVYRYGLLAPDGIADACDAPCPRGAALDSEDAQLALDVVNEQMWLAHRYYNDLVEVEHARRQAYRWARDKVGPEELKEVSKRLDEERKDICNSRPRDPDWGPGLRGTCGLYSGTYLMIEAQVQQAVKAALAELKKKKKRRGKKPPNGLPRFRRWDGSGSIGVQCSTPIPVTELLWGSSRLGRVDFGPRFRVTKQHPEGRVVRDGVWLTIPVAPGGVRARFAMVMHRPLPADARVLWIKVTRRREGTRERWEAHLTVEAASLVQSERRGPVAAVDLCWSRGRVGHLLAEDGFEEPVCPHPDILKKLRYADAVRSTRDELLNEAKEWAAEHIDARVRSWPRMHARGLLRKMRQWREEGHDLGVLEAWRKRDRHLYQIESGVRSKAKRRLKYDYRVWAKGIVKRYPVIVLEDMDLRQSAEDKVGSSKRFAYAPSHLRDALVGAGARIVKIPLPFTSRECHRCGGDVSWSSDYHRPVCTNGDCGWRGERRVNNVRNILASGLVALDRPVPLALRDILRDSGPRSARRGTAADLDAE